MLACKLNNFRGKHRDESQRATHECARYTFVRAPHTGDRCDTVVPMRTEYDFSKSRKNPYSKHLKRQITIRLDTTAVDYFKQMAADLGMPYQNLINLYLRDCAFHKRRPTIQWPGEAKKTSTRR